MDHGLPPLRPFGPQRSRDLGNDPCRPQPNSGRWVAGAAVVQACIDGRKQPQGGPVKVRPTTEPPSRQGGHGRGPRRASARPRSASTSASRKSLIASGAYSWRGVATVDDLLAITLVDPGIEQRIGQDIEGEVAVDASFPHQRQHLAHAFESRVSTLAASLTRFAEAASSPITNRR